MSRRLLTALHIISRVGQAEGRHSPLGGINPRAKILVVICFLVAMLSMPIERLSELMLFSIYPIISASMGGIGYGRVLRRSLIVVPFVALIALPNLFLQREVAFQVGGVAVRVGLLTLLSIVLRGILSLQAVIILVATTSLRSVCSALREMGVPALLVTQIFFISRYMGLLVEEALAMQRARAARGFGRERYPLKMWARLISQLLLRSARRAEEIGRAMAARQFRGDMPPSLHQSYERWRGRDTLYLVAWCGTLLLLRVLHFAERLF